MMATTRNFWSVLGMLIIPCTSTRHVDHPVYRLITHFVLIILSSSFCARIYIASGTESGTSATAQQAAPEARGQESPTSALGVGTRHEGSKHC
jgi:hypothetical protein